MFTTYHNRSLAPAASAHRLSNLLDQFLHDAPPSAKPNTVLPLAIWEDDTKVHVEFDVPGVTESDLDISLHDNVLTVTAERKVNREGVRFDSRTAGKFEQRISVPVTVDDNSVDASLANGVLAVTMAKVPEPKPRKITVNVKSQPAAERN